MTGMISVEKRWSRRWGWLEGMVLVGVGWYLIISIAPLFLAAYYSLTNLNPLYATTDFIGLGNYTALFTDPQFIRAITMTVKISLTVTLAVNVGGLLIALLLNNQSAFYNGLKIVFFIPQVLSAVIVSFIWKILLTHRGLVNTVLQQTGVISKAIPWLGKPTLAFYSLALVVTWQLLGFCAVIYLASLQSIPHEMVEAAQIDGANRVQRFRHITWPLLAPGVTINVVLLLIMVFKLYDQVAVLTAGGPGGRTETLSYYIIRMGFTANQAGYASAMAVLLFLSIALISGVMVTLLKRREVEL